MFFYLFIVGSSFVLCIGNALQRGQECLLSLRTGDVSVLLLVEGTGTSCSRPSFSNKRPHTFFQCHCVQSSSKDPRRLSRICTTSLSILILYPPQSPYKLVPPDIALCIPSNNHSIYLKRGHRSPKELRSSGYCDGSRLSCFLLMRWYVKRSITTAIIPTITQASSSELVTIFGE